MPVYPEDKTYSFAERRINKKETFPSLLKNMKIIDYVKNNSYSVSQ